MSNQQQLAASQLREKGYREALTEIRTVVCDCTALDCTHPDENGECEMTEHCYFHTLLSLSETALAQPSDQSQLEAYVAERVLHLRAQLEGFVELYGEVPLEGSMIAPGHKLWHDYYQQSGRHMILTDEGWEPGEAKQSYLDELGTSAIYDEVNAPEGNRTEGAPSTACEK